MSEIGYVIMILGVLFVAVCTIFGFKAATTPTKKEKETSEESGGWMFWGICGLVVVMLAATVAYMGPEIYQSFVALFGKGA